MKRILLLTLFMVSTLFSYAQDCSALMEPVSLQARTNEATHIVEGEVVNSVCYWDVSHNNIYTIHKVTVYKNAKGANATTIFVETEGGQVGDAIQTTSSAAKLRKGYEGVFFLKNSNHSFSIPQTTYKMVAAAQGYIKYDRIDNIASDVFEVYPSIENDLYSKLEQTTSKKLAVIQEKQAPPTTNSFLATPVISGLSPTTITAGTQSLLTITGSNFGATAGEVSFKNASTGGTSYIASETAQVLSWSDTQIQVEVPATAGSGTIRVTNATSETGTSSASLTIPYSHLNATGSGNAFPTMLQNDNGSGGFSFEYHTDFNTSNAKQYFEEAFGLWNCESGVNFIFGATTTTDVNADDGINIVRFDNGAELATGVLGSVTTRLLGSCPTTGRAVVKELDVTWNDTTNWYYGSGTPSGSQYDFKSVALHELGHAHQMGHIINSSGIMHYNIGAGQEKFSLNADDVDAANYTMGIFTVTPGCGISPMTVNNACPNVPEVTLDPVNVDQCVNTDAVFTITATNAVTYQWQENNGSNWSDITDDATYGGATTATLTITNITFALSSNHYRCVVANAFGVEVNSGYAQLIADEYPIGSAAVTEEACGGDIGVITFSFSNNSIRTGIEFSIDDGVTYPYTFSDNIGSATASDLAAGSYDVWVRWGNNECPLDLGLLIIQSITPPSATVTSVDIIVGVNDDDGKLQFAFTDDASQTNIAFSIDNGVTYPYSYDDTIGNAEISNLMAGNYQVWSRWDDATCATDLGTFTISEFAYTYVPDDNFESYLEANGMGNGIANDDYVLTSNISGLTFLSVTGQGISDFTGLEDFLAVETLFVMSNTMSSIDVTANVNLKDFRCTFAASLANLNVSTLTNLETLDISGTSISTINVDNNTALKTFWAGAAGISTLDVSNNLLLEFLHVANTAITNLDVSANTALTSFYGQNSALESLDIKNGNNTAITTFLTSGNPNLSCIKVDDANYSAANWSIDTATTVFSETCTLTYVPDDNFENYLETHNTSGTVVSVGDATSMGNGVANDNYVDTNRIETVTTLNIYNQNIGNLIGIEDFIAVATLYFDNNQIMEVDLTNNIAIVNLTLGNNQISELDLSQNTLLNYFVANDNLLEDLDFSQNVLIQYIDIYNNLLTDLNISQNAQLIGLGCRNNPLLGSIDLTGNTALESLDAENCSLTSLVTSQNLELNYLVVKNNQLMAIDVSSNIKLEDLTCDYNQITDLDLSLNPLLERLKATNNALTSLDVKNGNNGIISHIKTTGNPNLTCVLVDDTNYSTNNWDSQDKDAQTFYNEDCIQTYVPDDNFESFLEANGMGNGVANDNYVTTSNISGVLQLIVSNQAIVEMTGIEDFISLEKLYCSNNQIENITLTQNTALTDLGCENNLLGAIDVTQNTALKNFNFDSNQISSIDLTQNTALEHLTFGDNDFTDMDLSQNTSLNYLIGSYNLLESMDLSMNTLLSIIQLDNNQLTSLNVKNGNNGIMITFDIQTNANLTCVLVDNATAANSGTGDYNGWLKDAQTNYNDVSCDIYLSPKVFLQGAALNPNTGEESLMRDDLRVAGLLETTSPYVDAATCDAGVFNVTGNDAIVDWVWVELRGPIDVLAIQGAQSALLQRDGDVVGLDGVSELAFNVVPDNYYVVIKHRNHLGIMSANTIALSNTVTAIDFTDSNNPVTYGNNGRTSFGMPFARLGMWAGNAGGDATSTKYQGSGNDSNAIKDDVLADAGNTSSSNLYSFTGYSNADVNMDGTVKYQGSGNDSNTIKDIILSHPDNTSSSNLFSVDEQIPTEN